MDILKKVQSLAESEEFDLVNHLGQWNGWEIYVADTNEECAIGLPQYILASDKEVRWASDSETLSIMAFLNNQ